MIALADCNNFYVSCERVFNRNLCGRPIVILSNNDGCAVALSDEAKNIGIKRGTPFFQCRKILEDNNGYFLSSNYSLYADMSHRVMNIISDFSPEVEIYSIDEAFLTFDEMPREKQISICKNIKQEVFRYTAIPVSIGIACTKTLAKTANHYIKKTDKNNGVCLIDAQNYNAILEFTRAGDIWGIGYEYSQMLNAYGIITAADFIKCDDDWIRKKMTVTGLRTLHELRGENCITMQTVPPSKKGIASTRSFGRPVLTLSELEEAVSDYADRAAVRLRAQKSQVSTITVFLATNRFKDDPQYHNSATASLHAPTNFTGDIINAAVILLRRIFKSGYRYKKTGIIFSNITHISDYQPNLFANENNSVYAPDSLMTVYDNINKRFGANSISFASQGISKKWSMRREFLSNKYTTDWNEIPVVII